MSAKKKPKQHYGTAQRESVPAKQPVKHTQKYAGKHSKKKKTQWTYPLTRKNYMYAAIALGVIIVGYLLMATGITESPALPNSTWDNPWAVSVAPVVLVIGYCIIMPYALFKLFKKDEEK